MASASNPKIEERPKAWKFLVENFDSLYTREALPPGFEQLAFVPAKEAGGVVFLGKPTEVRSNNTHFTVTHLVQVYTDPQVVLFGFSITQAEIPQAMCDRFKIVKQPRTDNIVNLLKVYPPRDVGQANSWFEALASRIPGVSCLQVRKSACSRCFRLF
jgi:hypothetical protein